MVSYQSSMPWKAAILSDDKIYRYFLSRVVNLRSQSRVLFVMLNPSTADATEDDPTIRRCVDYAIRWGFGELGVVNLFAYRTSDPDELVDATDYGGMNIVGWDNDYHIRHAARFSNLIVAAWGSKVSDDWKWSRPQEVVKLLRGVCLRKKIHCLKTSKSGQPRHPLYLRQTLKPVLWLSPLDTKKAEA